MTDVTGMNAALLGLGFSTAAANAIVVDQSIDSVAKLATLLDSGVESLCKIVRRPGGFIPNPVSGARQPATIPNPGNTIPFLAEDNLKLAAYWCRYRVKTSRLTTPADIVQDVVLEIRDLRDWEKEHKDADPDPAIIKGKDWTKNMEKIRELLRNSLGSTGIPLAYVVRENEEIAQDPEEGWPTPQDEMIARAPINSSPQGGDRTATFKRDNQRVWVIMATLTTDHECWTYVHPFQRRRDGRGAFLALWAQFLGPNNVDNMAAMAEMTLAKTVYYGEKKRWNFEKCVRQHIAQHTILENLVPYGYAGIDNRSKVRHLLDSVKTKQLDSVKTQIIASANLRNDFDACVTLYKDFIKQMTSEDAGSLNVSEVKTVANPGKRPSPSKVDHVEDRYYDSAEYSKLSPTAKSKLHEMRQARGHKPAKRSKTTPADGKTLSDRTIKAIAAEIHKASVTATEDHDNDKSDGEVGGRTNRNHPALTRQKK